MRNAINMHIGYRGFGAIGSDIKLTAKRLGQVVDDPNNDKKKKLNPSSGSKVTEEINIGNQLFHTHGIEAGLTFHFASKA
ncbi:hypothetical protein [Wolbachia endosymbiont (group A) of Melieria omissa]|uniref:hypothetical protein n=1 Tax=Wolbachia endosymbiont (group A) of Melieria omissa TaxID=3139311 RepID=UPI003CCB35E9